MSRLGKRHVVWIAMVGVLALSGDVLAQERGGEDEPRLWNPTFVYGAAAFGESDSHRTLGVSVRIRLGDRLNVEPEFRYMSLASRRFESSQYRRERKHSDFLLAGHIVYDFRDEAETRFVPYASFGAGWGRTRNLSSSTELVVDDAVPVFPTPTAPLSSSYRTSEDWFWVGVGVGIRILLPHGFFVSPEVRLGETTRRELVRSAAVKVGYGF